MKQEMITVVVKESDVSNLNNLGTGFWADRQNVNFIVVFVMDPLYYFVKFFKEK